ncbi:NAD-dependent protein deacetylase sirtuin-7 isoform X3 [Columba livia]
MALPGGPGWAQGGRQCRLRRVRARVPSRCRARGRPGRWPCRGGWRRLRGIAPRVLAGLSRDSSLRGAWALGLGPARGEPGGPSRGSVPSRGPSRVFRGARPCVPVSGCLFLLLCWCRHRGGGPARGVPRASPRCPQGVPGCPRGVPAVSPPCPQLGRCVSCGESCEVALLSGWGAGLPLSRRGGPGSRAVFIATLWRAVFIVYIVSAAPRVFVTIKRFQTAAWRFLGPRGGAAARGAGAPEMALRRSRRPAEAALPRGSRQRKRGASGAMAAGGSLSRSERKAAARAEILQQEEQRDRRRQVSRIWRKPPAERSPEECQVLGESDDIVRELERRRHRRERLRRRQEEVCDEPEELQRKVSELAAAVRNARHLVIYTGAGISTAASIPDYRGPNGIWTLMQKGRSVRATDLSEAEPTLTHMSIACLHKHNLVQHVVSQNCDGLHLRSGLPRAAISELHGNMYIEVCTSCTPNREYVRVFDVTERTALHRHHTGRMCHKCGAQLRDTIVHFGEKGTLRQPLNWEAATEAASKADVILCLGSSLKTTVNSGVGNRPPSVIVSLPPSFPSWC